ncbi:cytochrome oxidase assembly protein ShyY1 [Homoserinimonas aerilata]|uniref:SURF1-like protein n=1 Tax=Homoserinimonas aerilata TaxID=1162970 RepID=A0A542YIX3_9MICO|nr:SURF1 family protein [Homoserinimonas aerilata]TQL48043.1 cytochrome oxidase assembly protein ShyY1 [Homoserinimonas aerilata]
MSGWRFVLSARWAGYLALVLVFATVSCMFGNWQFDRRAEARAAIDLVEANYDREPQAVTEVLPTLDSYRGSQKWTPVLLNGVYLSDDEMLVRNRPFRGSPGFEILTPLLLDDGTVFIVDRGWVPVGSRQDAPDEIPPAPQGEVEVVARLKAGEPVLEGRGAPAGTNQIATINLGQVSERLEREMYTGAYGIVSSQEPAPASVPLTPDKPEADEGPHLSYALQWYVFALLAFVGLGWALRQEYRVVNADDPEVRRQAEERERKRAQRKPDDAETEDALLDSV